jgi:hypothetical protein
VPIGGGSATNGFIATGRAPSGVVVAGGKLYWSNQTDGTIGRANLDGTGVDNSFVTGINTPRGLATDGTYVYWSSFYGNKVGRIAFDGTGLSQTFFNIGFSAQGIAISGGALYWAEFGFGDIGRLNLTTSASTYVYTNGTLITGMVATGPGFAAAGSGAFGGRNLGTSGSQTFTFSNTDTGPATEALTFGASAITLTGTNANQFAKGADSCSGQTIAVGASCSVTVTFTPTTTGAKTANLRLVDNAASSPQTLALTGTGTQATFAVSPAAKDFGGVAVGTTGTAQTFVVSNTASGGTAGAMTIPAGGVTLAGTDPGQFTITADGCSGQAVAPGGTCSVSVAAAPTSAGAKTATLRFADDATGAPHTVALAVLGRAPAVTLDPGTLDFGGVLAGRTSALRTLTVTNSASGAGADDLVLGTATVAGADAARYAIETDSCSGQTVAPGGQCTIGVRFTPGTTGAKTAVLRLADNAPGAPQQVALLGTGTQPEIAFDPATFDFGDVAAGDTSAARTFTVTNSATGPTAAPLTFAGGAVTTTDPAFAITADGCSGTVVAPGDSCTVAVRFAPTAGGVRVGALRFADDGPDSPQGIALAGTGRAAALALTPTTWNFGAVTLGTTSAAATFTLANHGNAPATPGAATTTGAGYAVTADQCAATLAPGDTCTVAVAFAPTAVGAADGTLTVGGVSAVLSAAGVPVATGGGSGSTTVTVTVPASDPQPAPTPSPSATSAPSATPATTTPRPTVLVGRTVRVDRRGVARVTLRCVGPRGARCSGAVRLKRAGAAANFRVRTGGRTTLGIALRGRCHAGLTPLRLTTRGAGATATTRMVKVRLRCA